MIKSKDISIVVQGPISEGTKLSTQSIRKYLPDATIILSTWEGSDTESLDYDELLLNKDPGSFVCCKEINANTNINRQLVSTQNGLNLVKTKYAMKLRSDLYLTNNSFLEYFDKFSISDEKMFFVKHRMITSSLTSKRYSDAPNRRYCLLPFHLSDWFMFGLTEDIRDYYSTLLIEDEKTFSDYPFKYLERNPVPTFTFRYAPEQFFCYSWLKRHYTNFSFEDWTDWNEENQRLYEKIIANNFIVLDTIQHGMYSKKHFDFINDNDGESFEFDGYISHLYFSKLYKKYCDKTYKIPSKYFLIEDKFANKTAARLKKAKVKFARKKYLKLFDIVFYASLLTILKLKIALSNLVLSKEDVK